MSLRTRRTPSGFIVLSPTALTRRASVERSGLDHEIKHDGFRLMARRDSVRLLTRNGIDWSSRFLT
jgi:ATP-dependent DNA ligase